MLLRICTKGSGTRFLSSNLATNISNFNLEERFTKYSTENFNSGDLSTFEEVFYVLSKVGEAVAPKAEELGEIFGGPVTAFGFGFLSRLVPFFAITWRNERLKAENYWVRVFLFCFEKKRKK